MEELKRLVEQGDMDEVEKRVRALLDENTEPQAILRLALIPAMDTVGDLFQSGEYYLPEMLVAARAMKRGLEVLRPLLAERGIATVGKIVVGTVRGDMHDIGKNLVAIALEGAGFEVVDLGVDVPASAFAGSVREHRPLAVAMSALLTSTMSQMKAVVGEIEEAGLRGEVRLMIGGAPVTEEYRIEVGADFYGPDSTAARDYARSLLD